MKSKLIMIEGCDGCGKTTMVKDLKNDIKNINKDLKVLTVSLPHYNSFGYAKIRDILSKKQTKFYPPDIIQSLYLINMIDCFEKVVNPFFEENPENAICIIDRSLVSTLLYNAINDGSIYNNIRIYMKKRRLNGDTSISEDDSILDLDMILNKYCHLNKKVDYLFFLNPPVDIVIERAKNRNSKEEFDSTAYVQRMHFAYDSFCNFISCKMPRSIIDFIEGPEAIIKPDLKFKDRVIQLNKWNRLLSDQDNHKILRDIVLNKLGLI